ncbi:unnamed protein product [Sphenostylis stenocarpa]|uniref:Uncharacterized protein n=1 Tax=Sphenostylis stenocarpa TaxID=92480 RepID=A0AA86VWT9_9FABA|nr:unnamed protein product [Sphenostylis stenocarpa]
MVRPCFHKLVLPIILQSRQLKHSIPNTRAYESPLSSFPSGISGKKRNERVSTPLLLLPSDKPGTTVRRENTRSHSDLDMWNRLASYVPKLFGGHGKSWEEKKDKVHLAQVQIERAIEKALRLRRKYESYVEEVQFGTPFLCESQPYQDLIHAISSSHLFLTKAASCRVLFPALYLELKLQPSTTAIAVCTNPMTMATVRGTPLYSSITLFRRSFARFRNLTLETKQGYHDHSTKNLDANDCNLILEICRITRTKPRWEDTLLSLYPSINFSDPSLFLLYLNH